MTKYEYWCDMEQKALQNAHRFVDDRYLFQFWISAAVGFYRRRKNSSVAEAEEVVK